MHPDIEKLGKLLRETDEQGDEIVHDPKFLENFTPDSIPPEIKERNDAIWELRRKIQELAPSRLADIEAAAPPVGTRDPKEWPVYDPIARQFTDAYHAEEASEGKRLLTALARRIEGKPISGCEHSTCAEQMENLMHAYPSLFPADASKRYWRACSVAELLVSDPPGFAFSDLHEFQPYMSPLKPLRREIFFEAIRQRRWDVAYLTYYEWRLFSGGEDPELDGLLWEDSVTHEHIARLSEETREALIFAIFKNDDEEEYEKGSIPYNAVHPLDDELGSPNSTVGRKKILPFFNRGT